MKILHLTGMASVPNELGEEKIAKANDPKPRDDGGMPLSFYRLNNLRPPDDIEEEILFDENGIVILSPADVDIVYTSISFPVSHYAGTESQTDGTSIVYTTTGLEFNVCETYEEIDEILTYHSLSWFKIKLILLKLYVNKLGLFKRKK